jgi:hypothetical protein
MKALAESGYQGLFNLIDATHSKVTAAAFQESVKTWLSKATHPEKNRPYTALDAAREYAYDRDSAIGRLDKALDEATAKGGAVVDMKNDWKAVYPASE